MTIKHTGNATFDTVLEELMDRYWLTINYPNNDSYFELTSDWGEVVCRMNPEGYNLLYNLEVLTTSLGKWYLG